MKKPARHGRINSRHTVVPLVDCTVAAKLVLLFAKVHEATYEQIEPAVIVVVEPNRTGSPTGRADTGFLRNVGKSSVAVVVIQNAFSVLGQVEIGEAVVIVVAHCGTHAIAPSGYACFLRHVAEGAVPIVAIESIAEWLIRIVEIATSAIDQVNIHPAVIVVVEKSAARAGGFRQVVLRRASVGVLPCNPASRRGYDRKQRF